MGKKYKEYPPTKDCIGCGKCCKRMSGHYSPTDFKDLSYDGLKSEIEKGRISVDWWSEVDREKSYYLRARHIDAPVVDPSWGGICMNLTKNGCSLPREERPLGCRTLKPEKGKCDGEYSKEICKNEWKQYSDVLEELVEYYGGAYDVIGALADFLEVFLR